MQSVRHPYKPNKVRNAGNVGLTQAYDLRDLAAKHANTLEAKEAKTLSEEVAKAKAIQAYGTLWREASDRIRILRGRPLPGSLKPVPKARKAPKPLAPSTEEP